PPGADAPEHPAPSLAAIRWPRAQPPSGTNPVQAAAAQIGEIQLTRLALAERADGEAGVQHLVRELSTTAGIDRPDPSRTIVAEEVRAAEQRIRRPTIDVAPDHGATEAVGAIRKRHRLAAGVAAGRRESAGSSLQDAT